MHFHTLCWLAEIEYWRAVFGALNKLIHRKWKSYSSNRDSFITTNAHNLNISALGGSIFLPKKDSIPRILFHSASFNKTNAISREFFPHEFFLGRFYMLVHNVEKEGRWRPPLLLSHFSTGMGKGRGAQKRDTLYATIYTLEHKREWGDILGID